MPSGSRISVWTKSAHGRPEATSTISPASTIARFEYFQRVSAGYVCICSESASRICARSGKFASLQYGKGASRGRPEVCVISWRTVMGRGPGAAASRNHGR
jgi:hypothetical protein